MQRHLFLTVFIITFLSHVPSALFAQFGVGGAVITDFPGYWMRANKILLQPDGKIISVGYDLSVANSAFAIAKYNLDGSPDTAFGTSGLVTTVIGDISGAYDVVRQSDGKIVVVGWSTLSSKKRFAIARYNSNGSLDTTFGSYGTTTTTIGSDEDAAYSVIQQPDGKLVVAGSTKSGSVISIATVRYLPDGSVDTAFGTSGKAITTIGSNSRAYSLIQQSDAKLLAAGYANGNWIIARFLNNGSLDTSFGGGGTGYVTTPLGSTDGIQQIIRQADGKLVGVGNGLASLALARYSSEGVLDATFNGTGIVTTKVGSETWGHGVIQQPDGMLVAAGYNWNNVSSQYNVVLARFINNGGLDAGFGSAGIVTTLIQNQSKTRSVLLQPDGKLAVAGDYDNGVGFLLARYLTNGALDTQDDPPFMTKVEEEHALAGQTLDISIRGWNLKNVVAVQLRNAAESVNATSINADDARIVASFTLNVSPGQYDLYLATNTINRTYKGVFTVCEEVAAPVQWQFTNLGKAGTPITGPMGIAIGDVDGDGYPEMYVANGDNEIQRYEKNTAWSITALPASGAGFFHDVALMDLDLDGNKEVYGANSFPQLFQYQWSGSSWSGNSFAAYSGSLIKADQTTGWLAEMYTIYGSDLMQTKMQHNCLYNTTCFPNASTILCGVSGDADNDQVNEVYFAANDQKVYQTWYRNYVNVFTRNVFSGAVDIKCLTICDLDRDGANELYGGDAGGTIRQFTWNGASWNAQTVNGVSTVANKIAVGDGDNNGLAELYAAGVDGHLYQCSWNGSNWRSEDLANAGEELVALAVGDGDGDGRNEVYGVGEEGNVYQFKAVSIPATATPTVTVTPTVTPIPTPLVGFQGRIIDADYIYAAPNPVRGHIANIVIFTNESARITAKLFTTTNREVLSFDRNYSQGQHTERVNISNLANGVYLLLVKARNDSGIEEKVIKKIAIVK